MHQYIFYFEIFCAFFVKFIFYEHVRFDSLTVVKERRNIVILAIDDLNYFRQKQRSIQHLMDRICHWYNIAFCGDLKSGILFGFLIQEVFACFATWLNSPRVFLRNFTRGFHTFLCISGKFVTNMWYWWRPVFIFFEDMQHLYFLNKYCAFIFCLMWIWNVKFFYIRIIKKMI